ncbi:MAG: hypothetical protein J07HQX50_02380 [Haloquadratum sp. J07HQX50]|nr:MAG: hypothetical protein J07HQX50_02380 [Haloquadratum sp. J07HQX50]
MDRPSGVNYLRLLAAFGGCLRERGLSPAFNPNLIIGQGTYTTLHTLSMTGGCERLLNNIH